MMPRAQRPREGADGRSRLRLIALVTTTFLAFLNFTGLLGVVPLWAAAGGGGSAIVGSTTGVMMAATVATQLCAPWLFRQLSLRVMVIVGAVLLGAPSPLYALSADAVPILTITAVRGVGFALIVLAGAVLIAEVAGEGRLAKAAAAYGVAGALPNVVALGGGVWAAEAWGFPVVFALAGATGLAGAALAWLLPPHSRGSVGRPTRRDVLRIGPTMVLFAASTAAFGAASTFLPVSGPDTATTALALLAASCGIVLGRFVAGGLADRIGSGRLLLPSALAVALGALVIGLTLDGPDWLLMLGAALVGTGFGACQNDSFVVTLDRFGPQARGTASTIWNIAYDGGVGIGALGLGWVIGSLGHAGAFIALATAIAAVALLSIAVRRRTAAPTTGG